MTTHAVRRLVEDGRARLRQAGAAARGVLGVPDYERYVAHMARHHPAERPLDRGEFVRRQLDARYSRPGARCC